MSQNCYAYICPDFDILIDDKAFTENTDTSSNIYGLNGSSVIAKKKFAAQLKCTDLKRMTKAQKYASEAKGYLFNLN